MSYEDAVKAKESLKRKCSFWLQAFGKKGRHFSHVNIEGWEVYWEISDDNEYVVLPKEMPTHLKRQAREEIAKIKKLLSAARKEHKKTGGSPKQIFDRLRKEEKERTRPMTYIEQMRMLEQTFKH